MIKLDGVSKQYIYGARVFAPVDMTINDGEIVALLGDELSGKTTFLKVVAGVTDSEGKVLFDGEPLAKKPDDVIMISTIWRCLQTVPAIIILPILSK